MVDFRKKMFVSIKLSVDYEITIAIQHYSSTNLDMLGFQRENLTR